MKSPIRERRLEQGLSQADLAKLAGTSQPQINRLEKSLRPLTPKWADRLAPHLGTSPEELLKLCQDAEDEMKEVVGTYLTITQKKDNNNLDKFTQLYNSTEELRKEIADLIDGTDDINLQFALATTAYKAQSAIYRLINPRLNPLPQNDSAITMENFVPQYRAVLNYNDQTAAYYFPKRFYTISWRPGSLANSKEGYAISMFGVDMEPRFSDGDVLYVVPEAKIIDGHDYLFRFHDQRIIVRRLVDNDGVFLTTKAFRLTQTETYRTDEIESAHRIVGVNFDTGVEG